MRTFRRLHERSGHSASEAAGGSFLQTIIDSVPASIAFIRYPEMEVGLMNARFRRNLGDEGLDDCLDRMPADVSKKILDALEHTHRSGELVIESEVPMRTPDGRSFYCNMYVIPQVEPTHGNILVTMVDITAQVDRRKGVEELVGFADLERKRLQTVLEAMPLAIMVVDRHGNIIVANEALRRFIEPSTLTIFPDIPGLEGYWSDTGIKINEDEWPVVSALRGGCISGAMADLRIKDGSMRTVMGSACPVIMGGEISGAVVAFLDITDQRKAEQEAVRARSEMELYLDLLTHDVNNMNAGAKGYLELLLRRDGLDDKALQYAGSSCALMDDIARLVENVRKLQRAEEESLHRFPIDVNMLIGDVVTTYRNVPSDRASISFRPGERAWALGNALLKDVFENIVGNAIKHAGGPVDIEIVTGRCTTEEGEFVRVDITDTGPGIPDDVKEVLFNRMQRGRTAASGHGLGLYLARTVLEMFGGRIWVDDRVPGEHAKGARFAVLIPADAPPQM